LAAVRDNSHEVRRMHICTAFGGKMVSDLLHDKRYLNLDNGAPVDIVTGIPQLMQLFSEEHDSNVSTEVRAYKQTAFSATPSGSPPRSTASPRARWKEWTRPASRRR
jgi:hypothetical protein